MIDPAALGDEELEAQFLVADKRWETDRRTGGWNLPQREERNALGHELARRRAVK